MILVSEVILHCGISCVNFTCLDYDRQWLLMKIFVKVSPLLNTGLFKNKYTLSKISFTKTADDKSMSCVRMERKSLKVLIWISIRCQVRTQLFCLPRGVMCSVGRAGLSIWHLPRHTWGSHRVLVRCEHNFESSSFSLYIARRHMFNSTCKTNF
jgi:hypothetical protein